ncbi:MAG: single-stranded DNA-binding protein [Actinobacteria bacterium]|nr:single-stranded DNA-binding protein [Actinomycetota bacterium]MBU1608475.1 single-stranded DNA-binding protein [Actinomycetota bacterium]MBU2316699.1 single-stranded DNA-binding protein [Actinomycetota bacterium]MBU2385463.1 single-stranded DNA-binding protein [Actinomycetota bacterium]
MTDTITLTGLVATNPRHIVTSEGLTITSFRLASNQRRFDRGQNAWIDGDTNWYTVTAFRQLGTHVATSLEKGQRVIVTGRVRIRDWETDEKSGTSIEIDADAIGHDLTWGRATFTRSVIAKSTTRDDPSESSDGTAQGPTEEDASPAEESADQRGQEALAATPF